MNNEATVGKNFLREHSEVIGLLRLLFLLLGVLGLLGFIGGVLEIGAEQQ